MKVLPDECVPKALKPIVVAEGHACVTVQDSGWSGKKNGELLDMAQDTFDVVTLDTNIHYQQSLAGRRIALIVVCAAAIADVKPGEVRFLRC